MNTYTVGMKNPSGVFEVKCDYIQTSILDNKTLELVIIEKIGKEELHQTIGRIADYVYCIQNENILNAVFP